MKVKELTVNVWNILTYPHLFSSDQCPCYTVTVTDVIRPQRARARPAGSERAPPTVVASSYTREGQVWREKITSDKY